MTGFTSKRQMAQDRFAEMLDLCDYLESNDASLEAQCKAAAFIREVLAQPVQEPFGYVSMYDNPIFQKEKPEIGRWETLYTTPQPRPWVGLTDEEISSTSPGYIVRSTYARAIEAALRSKNT